MLRYVIALALWALAWTASAEPLRALLLTSPGVYHNYELQTEVLTKGIARHMDIRFDVSLAETNRWKKGGFARGYDVVIYNICMADNQDADLIVNLRGQTEREGIPAVVIHCTMHSFRETEGWWPFIGLKTRHHEPLGEMRVEQVTPHRVLAGIPQDWRLPEDELYVNLAFGGQALLRATGHDGEHHTVAWLQGAGNAMVFGTTLGHSDATIADPVFQRLVANGILFVTGKLEGNGKAAAEVAPKGKTGDVVDKFSAPAGVKFLGADGQSCVYRQFALAVGPCYAGCTLNPFIWGEQADTCRRSCQAKLPTMDESIRLCSS